MTSSHDEFGTLQRFGIQYLRRAIKDRSYIGGRHELVVLPVGADNVPALRPHALRKMGPGNATELAFAWKQTKNAT